MNSHGWTQSGFPFSSLKLVKILFKLGFDKICIEQGKFKKNLKNGKPMHMFLICDILAPTIDKQGVHAFKKHMLV